MLNHFKNENYQLSTNRDNLIESKAELFSILQTANFLKKRFDNGLIDMDFYFRRMKFFHNELMSIQQLLSGNKTILDLVKNFPVNEDLKPILSVISSVQDYNFNQIARKWQLDPLQLAAEATKITSNFITLIDYLHLIDDFDEEFLMELLRDLRKSLAEMQTFEPFYVHVLNLEQELPKYFQENHIRSNSNPSTIKSVISEVEEIIYKIFQDFKQYLNIKA